MAGTWLDFDAANRLSESFRKALKRPALNGNRGGGRHWTRTSDLLHVKQGRRDNSPGLTSTENVRRLYLQANGWTLAGRR